ncbi:MAG TPA: DUF5926 family protein [Actinomycetospora sp.]|nr:DUF5926 family protein [Actinomycetospora sp.]
MARSEFVLRPFEGLPGEPDWVALREVVPAASATARTAPAHGAVDVLVVTLLPGAWPALHRADGVVLLALQQNAGSGDASRDLADLLLRAIELPAGTPIRSATPPADAVPRLQDVLDTSVPFEVTVHDEFDFWGVDDGDLAVDARATRDALDAVPTRRLGAVEHAYWTRMSGREYVRWAQPHDEEAFMDALARLHARRESGLGAGGADGRFIGAFRSGGLVIPVWELTPGLAADRIEEQMGALGGRLDAALAVDEPLAAQARRARAGLDARQLTLR